MMKALLLILLLCSLSYSFCFSQSKSLDSLKHELAIATHDTSRVLIMIDLIWFYRYTNPDSSLLYSEKATTLAHKIGFIDGEIQVLAFTCLTWQGLGNLPKALEVGFTALNLAEKNHTVSEVIGIPLGNIGYTYFELKDYPKAMSYFQRMKTLFENIHPSSVGYGFVYMDIGIVYEATNQLDSALFYLQHSLHYFNQSENGVDPHVFRSLGNTYFKLGNHQLALNYYQESLRKAVKNKDYRSSSLSNTLIAQFYKKTNKPDSSIYYAKRGLADGEAGNQKVGVLEAATLLSELYEGKDTKEAFRYYKIATTAKEGLFGAGNMKAIQAMVAQEEERRNTIEAESIAHQNQLEQYSLFGGLALLLLIAFFLYRNNRQKRKANIVLENTLSKLKSTQAQLIQSEKLASLGELTAGIAHEIQNPLNFVNNFSEMSVELAQELKDEVKKPEKDWELIEDLANDLSQNQEKINHHGKRASSIVSGMLEHSRASTGVKELTDINKLADEYLRLAYHGFKAKNDSFNIDLKTEFDSNLLKIEVIPQDMGRVLLNLINNAFWAVSNHVPVETGHALSLQSQYRPTVTISTQQSENQIIIKIKDNGIGMPETIKSKIFQPFFTTKPTGEGTGLGLSLAYDIVTKGHGGTIQVESVEGVGTTFTVKLPIRM